MPEIRNIEEPYSNSAIIHDFKARQFYHKIHIIYINTKSKLRMHYYQGNQFVPDVYKLCVHSLGI